MSPVPERIPQETRHRTGKGEEFFIRLSCARDVGFGNAVGPHRPPLIVISSQPDFGQIGPFLILGDLLGGKVTVIVINRLLGGERVQLLRRLGGQKKSGIGNWILDGGTLAFFGEGFASAKHLLR